MAAIAAILSIRLTRRPRTHHDDSSGLGVILGGLRHLQEDRRLLRQFSLVAFFGVIGMGYEAMIPAFAARVVQTGVRGYSTLLACGGIGATVGALVVASLGGVRRKERLTLTGMIIFGAALACAALIPVGLPSNLPSSLTLACGSICLLGAGFGAVLFYSSSMMRIQTNVPDHLRGRIMGIWMIVYSGSVPLGALWTGRAAESWGVALVMGVSASICIVTAVVVLASRALEGPHQAIATDKQVSASDESQ
jgi:predicted MFS family arabinose efflux permease